MSDLRDDLDTLRATASDRLAAADSADAVEGLRHALLGRSGELTGLLKRLGSVPPEERPALGRVANEVRAEVEDPSAAGSTRCAAPPWKRGWPPRRST